MVTPTPSRRISPDGGALARSRALTPAVSPRTYSVWLAQLLLAGIIIILVLMAQALAPQATTSWTFTAGISIIIVTTAATLAVPWDRLTSGLVLVVPLVDMAAIGLLTIDPLLSVGSLWLFPVVWIATYFGHLAIVGGLGLITVCIVIRDIEILGQPGPTMRLVVTLLSFGFISLFMHTSASQNRAFRQLLSRQADKLAATVDRTSRQEREVSLLLDAVDVGVVRLSTRGEIVYANETYRELYGLETRDPAARARAVEYDGFRGRPLAPERSPLSRIVGGDRFVDERIWLFDQHGEWHALSLSARDLADDGAEGSAALLVVHDITDVIRAESDRQTLAARVSHELRNPLTAVLGYSEMLSDDTDEQRTRDRAEAINTAAERMMRMIGELLQAPAEQAAAPVRQTTNLGQICADAVTAFDPAARLAGIVLRLDTAETVIVDGDGFRLRQVVDNLVSNALKYTLKGGRVRIAATHDGDTATLVVSDSGVGMSQSEVQRIFEPYFRTDSARASTTQGTGLGMGIVQSIVAEHGGTIAVQSEPGAGTKVTVTLPARPDRNESNESIEDAVADVTAPGAADSAQTEGVR